jgi:RND family efflux transporter MFP subunit
MPRHYRRAAAVAAILAAMLFCTLPVPFRVKCRCEVQPVNRRYVTAPYQGRLEVTLVEPGDTVKKGQLLARIDGGEIRKKLAATVSEQDGLATQRDIALANGDVATARVAEAELAGKRQQLEILQDQLDHLEIRSSIDGVVISGDLKKLQGAQLTVGQTLLEIGPLDEMIIEVAIADHDIAHVHPGCPVTCRLESLPWRSFRGELVRIHPRSESRESRNVFVGEVRLAAEKDMLRPGMRGTARLAADRKPPAWILFHRALEQALFSLGW